MSVNWELIPLLAMVFILPFFRGGEHEIIQIIFLSLPLFYLPILFSIPRKVSKTFIAVFWLWLIYLGVNVVSTINSASIALSVTQVMRLMGVFLYFVFIYLVIEKKRDLKLLGDLIIVTGFILSLISFYFIAFPPGPDFSGMNLVYAKYGHNHLADYLLFVLPVAMYKYLKTKTKTKEAVWTTVLLFLYIGFLLTFSRGAFLAMAVIVLWWILNKRKNDLRVLNFTPLVIVPLVLIIVAFGLGFINNSKNIISDSEIRSNWSLRQLIKPVNVEGRFDYWKQAIEGFKLKPILGTGPGTFRITSKRFEQRKNVRSWFAHNSLLQVLSETGLIGLTVIIALLYLIIIKTDHLIKPAIDLEFALILGAGGSLLQSLVDFNWDLLAILVLFWILIAAVMKVRDKTRVVVGNSVKFTVLFFSILLVIFTGIKTASMITASDERSVRIFPFSETKWVKTLENNKEIFDDKLIERSIVFNRDNQTINSLVADSIYKHKGALAALLYYKKLLVIDPSGVDYESVYKAAVEVNDFQLAIDCLRPLSKQVFLEKQRIYSHLIKVELPTVSIDTNIESGFYEDQLRKFRFSEKEIGIYLAKMYYLLGLSAYKYGYIDTTESFWLTAIYIAPEWSYFHVELANMYSLNGNDTTVKKTIDFCASFITAKDHCMRHYNQAAVQKTIKDVGFMKQTIIDKVN